MKITKIEPQKKYPDRKSIWVDGKFYCGVSEEILLKTGLREEQVISEAQLREVIKGEERRKAKEYALNLLGYRIRSEQELKDRLKSKGYSDEIVEDVLRDLRAVDLVDDLQFARAWIRNRMSTNPKGPSVLRNELWKKGVAKEIIDEVLREYTSDFNEAEVALKLARKRFGACPDLKDPATKRRFLGFLTRKGFSYQTSKKVMEELKEEAS